MSSGGQLLVTGATGFLGRQLVELATRQGREVTGTFHSREPPPGPGVRWQHLELLDPEGVASTIRALAPDAVIHAAVGPADASIVGTTRDGAAAVGESARSVGARLVHVSTDVVFDGRLGRPYREDDERNPLGLYGQAKAAAERAVGSTCPEACIARTSLILAEPAHPPGRQEGLVLDAIASRSDVRFFTDEHRSPIAVTDLAAALLELTATKWSGPLHVAGSEGLSRLAIARLIAQSRGHDPERVPGGALADQATPRAPDCRLDVAAASRLLTTRLRGAREFLSPVA